VVPGPRALRPIVVVDLASGTSRQLSEDSGGRPRQWIDERYLLIETFGSRLNSFVLVDTVTGSQRDFLSSPKRSVSNPRVSPDGGRIAFDATAPGGSPAVIVAPLKDDGPIPESAWTIVEEGQAIRSGPPTGDFYISFRPCQTTISAREHAVLTMGPDDRRARRSTP
jgi:Tol biopolymer transport system component